MASQYGVNVVTSVDSARPMRIDSSTPIAIVGTVVLPATVGTLDGNTYDKINSGVVVYFGSATKALSFFAKLKGTIREALDGIEDQNVQCPIIISAIKITDAQSAVSGETFHGVTTLKTAVITSLNGLKSVASEVGVKPKLIIAPRFSHDLAVATEMTSVASKLLAMAIVDLNASSESVALTAKASFGTKRVLLRDPYVKVWNTLTNSETLEPQSARVAGLMAWSDGQWEYGFADSFSNRVMNGIVGTARIVEFNAGENCEADRLRTASIGTVIRYQGFRTWGGETTDIDPIWQDHTRVRIFDRICETALDGLFWAIDRRATDVLKSVKDSVEQMLLALKGAGVAIGYSVFWDEEMNTKANITAGKFYLKAQMQNSPIVKRLEVNFSYTDKFGDVLIKMIS